MMLVKGFPLSASRLLNMVITIFVVVLFLHTIRLSSQSSRFSKLVADVDAIPGGKGSPEELYMNRLVNELQLSKQTQYRAWRIRPSEDGGDWTSVTDVHLNFEPHRAKKVDVEHPRGEDLQARKRMELSVHSSPRPGQTDSSDFLFGVSTTYERIMMHDFAVLRSWSRWLTDGNRRSNGASLIVMLVQASDDEVDEVDYRLQQAKIDAYVTTTEEPMSMARRYYELARILKTFSGNLAANGQEKRWFGLIDDSIFFPSLSYLRDRLFNYDSGGMHYIGLPSERSDWDEDGRRVTTYGGGALLFSLRAISRVPHLPCFERDRGNTPFRAKPWDMLLQDCLMKHTDMNMHVLPGFYSPNDQAYSTLVDSYETGSRPLLLHQSTDRYALHINKAHLVTNVCGEACFMQRYLFHDKWVLVNGVSITQYPDGLTLEHKPAGEASQQNTLTKPILPRRVIVDESTQSLEKTVLETKGRKNTWRLLDSAVGKGGAVWQAYVKKAKPPQNAETPDDAMDSVIVLIWEP